MGPQRVGYGKTAMVPVMPNPITRRLLRFAENLRFPQLTGILVAVFVIDLITPDPLPFVDEIILGLLSLLFASWRSQHKGPPD